MDFCHIDGFMSDPHPQLKPSLARSARPTLINTGREGRSCTSLGYMFSMLGCFMRLAPVSLVRATFLLIGGTTLLNGSSSSQFINSTMAGVYWKRSQALRDRQSLGRGAAGPTLVADVAQAKRLCGLCASNNPSATPPPNAHTCKKWCCVLSGMGTQWGEQKGSQAADCRLVLAEDRA